jgi:hypothetical protein
MLKSSRVHTTLPTADLGRARGKPSGAHTQMAFVVEDIDSEVRELKARGVVFEDYDLPGLKTVEGIVQRSALKAAWSRTPTETCWRSCSKSRRSTEARKQLVF